MPSEDQQATFDEFETSDESLEGSSTTAEGSTAEEQTDPVTVVAEETPASTTLSAGQTATDTSQFETGDRLTDAFLETVSGAEIKESSARSYETSLKRYVRYLDDRDVSVLDADVKDVKEHYREMARANLATSTLKGASTAIIQFYKYIRKETPVDAEIEIYNLCDLDPEGFQTRDRTEREPLSEAELERLFDAMEYRRNRLMVLLASEIGARNASLRRIRLSDVHLDEKYVQLENTKSDRVYTVPISTEMTLELERWIQVERDKSSTSLDSPYLFPGVYKDRLENSSSLWRIVTEAAERAGIQEVVDEREPTEAERRQGTLEGPYRQYRVNPHLLRHTFSSLLEEAGLDSEARRDALDHEDVETTQEYYTHTGSDYEPLMRKLFHGENPGRN